MATTIHAPVEEEQQLPPPQMEVTPELLVEEVRCLQHRLEGYLRPEARAATRPEHEFTDAALFCLAVPPPPVCGDGRFWLFPHAVRFETAKANLDRVLHHACAHRAQCADFASPAMEAILAPLVAQLRALSETGKNRPPVFELLCRTTPCADTNVAVNRVELTALVARMRTVSRTHRSLDNEAHRIELLELLLYAPVAWRALEAWHAVAEALRVDARAAGVAVSTILASYRFVLETMRSGPGGPLAVTIELGCVSSGCHFPVLQLPLHVQPGVTADWCVRCSLLALAQCDIARAAAVFSPGALRTHLAHTLSAVAASQGPMGVLDAGMLCILDVTAAAVLDVVTTAATPPPS